MQLKKGLFFSYSKLEIVEEFNELPIENKIYNVESFSFMVGAVKDEKGVFILRSLGHGIFAKQYLLSIPSKKTGWTKEIFFFYEKDENEIKQEDYIKNLIK